jgi:type II secretory ATPase GspE/PulE/Tfp pilus assembly ATPase PilB-like protein
LVTGPTGSGKTRTLYSCLNTLNQSHRNLCTIEDPIEIRVPGINQVAYHPRAGLDFPIIIKALLRQDPDVIMIGEIRDNATAELAIQAAQTGHLVLSTLHTRNARGVIPRLKSLGIDQEAIESSLHCVSSQRLVPMLCLACRDLIVNDRSNCHACNGNGYLGRIGIHEILTIEQLLDPNIPFMDIATAGMRRLEEGIIAQDAFAAEVGAWH